MALKSNAALEDHMLRVQRLTANFTITAHATPASKIHSVDIPGVIVLRTQGKTADADAIEDGITWTTADDKDGSGDSVFGVVVNLGENIADKVYSVTLTEVSTVSTSEALSSPTGVTSYVTENGNIAFEIAATGLDLETESPTFRMDIVYREAR